MMEQQKINFAISFAAAARLLLASADKITAKVAQIIASTILAYN